MTVANLPQRSISIIRTYLVNFEVTMLFVLLSFFSWGCVNVEVDKGSGNNSTRHEWGSDLGNRTAEMWEYEEWSLDNPTWKGNPFDLVAKVTFEHQGSDASHTTEMFYDDDDTWKFRFTGTKTGTWTYRTSSEDPDLDNFTGTVIVNPNPEPDTYGFVTNVGNKWARFQGNDGDVETFLPQFAMAFPNEPSKTWTSSAIDQQLNLFFDGHGFNGVFLFGSANWVDSNIDPSVRFDRTSQRDPDPIAFENFERVITEVHDQGGLVHIWYVGDSSRRQSAQSAFGAAGAKTPGEQRLLRYIAARLAPLPGWIMGYGYDNNEHVTTSELQSWGNYLRERMGWQHFLGARDQGQNIEYNFWPEADFYSRGNWFNGVPYDDAAAAIDSDPSKPHSFDERWWKSRLNEEGQRQLRWQLAMAGGASGIWAADGSGDAYDHPEWFSTVGEFWEGRFLANMERANSLTNGYGLKTSDNRNYVFYKENTDSIQVDLSQMEVKQPVVAVNTKKKYAELDLGMLDPKNQIIKLPQSSDWAIAVGTF